MLSRAKANLCAPRGAGYVFHGACWQGTLAKHGAVASLAAYKTIGIGVTFGASNATGAPAVAVRDAVDDGDITGKVAHKGFPQYQEAGDPLMYFDFHNSSAKSIAFAKTPAIVVSTDETFKPGAECGMATLQGGLWYYVPQLSGSLSGKILTYKPLKLPGKTKLTLPAKGDLYAVAWCSGY